MFRYIDESRLLLRALKASRPKITVFVIAVFSIVTIVGTLMYAIEGPENGYASIPESMYWGILAVPTGIISYELAHNAKSSVSETCLNCSTEYDASDDFCRKCGNKLKE